MTGQFSSRFDIDGRPVGAGAPVYVVAEAGVAHFGDERKAYALVDLAVAAGADAVKFQVFRVDALISRDAPEWRERLASRQLPFDAFARICDYCRQRHITFFATAHDEPSLEFVASLRVPVYKIGSGEVRNPAFIRRAASLGRPVIASTGLHRTGDVEELLSAVTAAGNRDVAVLHCVTAYPTAPPDVRLGAIDAIRRRFGVVAGYSDHTRGFHIPLAAVAAGARVIEKHITLDFDVPNAQDWKVSCGPDDFGTFISQLRGIEAALAGPAEPSDSQIAAAAWAAKSLVAARDLAAGTVLCRDDLRAKRPGTGIPPSRLQDVIGRRTAVRVAADRVIAWTDLA